MAKKKIKRNEIKHKGKGKKGGNMFVTNILIPALSLIISTIAIIIGVYNYMLATKEYQYKLDPIVTAYAPSPIIENKNEYIYLSLTTHVKQILANYCLGYEVTSLDEKYRNLVKDVIALYDHKNERIERLAEENHYMLKSIIDALEED